MPAVEVAYLMAKIQATLLTMFLLAGLAGCSSPDENGLVEQQVPGNMDSEQESPDNETSIVSLPMQIAATAGNQSVIGGVDVSPIRPSNGGELPMEGNATALVVEAKWTC